MMRSFNMRMAENRRGNSTADLLAFLRVPSRLSWLHPSSGDRERRTPTDRPKAGPRLFVLRNDVGSQECNPASRLANVGAGLKIAVGGTHTLRDKREISGEIQCLAEGQLRHREQILLWRTAILPCIRRFWNTPNSPKSAGSPSNSPAQNPPLE